MSEFSEAEDVIFAFQMAENSNATEAFAAIREDRKYAIAPPEAFLARLQASFPNIRSIRDRTNVNALSFDNGPVTLNEDGTAWSEGGWAMGRQLSRELRYELKKSPGGWKVISATTLRMI
jgi:hypothetical protein